MPVMIKHGKMRKTGQPKETGLLRQAGQLINVERQTKPEIRCKQATGKRLVSLLCVGALLTGTFGVSGAFAESISLEEMEQQYQEAHAVVRDPNAVKVFVNGTKLGFDADPEIQNGRTFVPMRQIFEALGAEVAWNQTRKEIVADRGFDEIILKIGSKIAIFNESCETLEAAPYLKDGRTMVPLRFIGEALNCDVQWDGDARTVNIATDGSGTAPGGDSQSAAGTSSGSSTDAASGSTSGSRTETALASDGNGAARSILGEDAEITYNDAFQRAVRNSSSCISARLALSKAERQSEEFNNLFSMNLSFSIMQKRKDLQLLNSWQERNVIVTEEQAAFQAQNAMDAISLKLAEMENQKDAIAYAKKCCDMARLRYEQGMGSLKDLTAAQAEVSTQELNLTKMETELDGLYGTLYSDLGLTQEKCVPVEYLLDYAEIGPVNMQQEYNRAVANDPYIWYVENAAENADFDLQTYEWNAEGQSWNLTKMDLQAARNKENETKKALRSTLESRYNQLLQLEDSIRLLEDQKEALLENIDTMRTLYETGLKSRNDFEAVLQNNRTIAYNILSLQLKHEQLKTTFIKPYLNPTYLNLKES